MRPPPEGGYLIMEATREERSSWSAGSAQCGMPGDWRGFPGNEGTGSFFFWPPVPTACKRIRVTVSTLWEAAWAEVELPRLLGCPRAWLLGCPRADARAFELRMTAQGGMFGA
jgi:hypothetical protein